jgi:hypothetical protein
MLRWYIGGLLAALAISWIASRFHSAGFAPIGLLSICVGLALGATLSTIAVTQRVAGKWRLIIGTLILAVLTVLAQHAWLYLDFRRQWQEARAESPQVAMFRPETPWSPAEYFAREFTSQTAALWALDAALISAAAVGAIVIWQRHKTKLTPTDHIDGSELPTPHSELRTPRSP